MRLSGLISGADTDTLINALLELERVRVYRQESKQVQLEQKQKAWRDVSASLQKVQDKLDPLRFPMVFRTRKVTVSDESVVSVTAEPGAAQASYTLQVVKLAQNHMITTGNKDLYRTADDQLGWAGTFDIGTRSDALKTITVEETDTLSSLAAKINAAGSGVLAHVVMVGEDQFRLVLTASESGEANKIQLENEVGQPPGGIPYETSLLTDILGLAEGVRLTLSEAQDAEIKINGESHTRSNNTFDNILPGISITAKKPSSEAVSATVDVDSNKMVQTVKDWVSALNAAQDQLKTLSAYDSEKKTAGILNGDSLVRSIQYNLRDVLSTKAEGLPNTLNMLSQVGIAYGAYGTADYGKIVVDEAKLKAAIERDPEAVARLFNAETGPIAKMYGYIGTLLDNVDGPFKVRDESLTKQIDRIKDTVERIEYQLEQRERILRQQFQQMEEAMARLQSQGNYLMMQLLGGTTRS